MVNEPNKIAQQKADEAVADVARNILLRGFFILLTRISILVFLTSIIFAIWVDSPVVIKIIITSGIVGGFSVWMKYVADDELKKSKALAQAYRSQQ